MNLPRLNMAFATKLVWFAVVTVALFTLISKVWFSPIFKHPKEFVPKDWTYIQQPDQISCGPTSAVMLLKHYGQDVPLKKIKEEAKTTWFGAGDNETGMTLPEFMHLALNNYIPCKMETITLKALKHYVSKDRPPMVLVRSGNMTWHWVVVIGYTEDEIFIADPGWGKKVTLSNENFVGCWNFSTDMRGNKIPTPDVMLTLVQAADVFGHTAIIPN